VAGEQLLHLGDGLLGCNGGGVTELLRVCRHLNPTAPD
jgi:hypothetical protein